MALGFGTDAQPERVRATTLSSDRRDDLCVVLTPRVVTLAFSRCLRSGLHDRPGTAHFEAQFDPSWDSERSDPRCYGTAEVSVRDARLVPSTHWPSTRMRRQ
jgi:hypothetical protein